MQRYLELFILLYPISEPNLLINTIMKLKILIFIFLAGNFPLFLLLHAQEILSVETNMFRANDTIVKQQVEYKNPGKTGENVFWNLDRKSVV